MLKLGKQKWSKFGQTVLISFKTGEEVENCNYDREKRGKIE